MKLCLSPIENIYSVCALLQKTHAWLYGNEAAKVFGALPATLQE